MTLKTRVDLIGCLTADASGCTVEDIGLEGYEDRRGKFKIVHPTMVDTCM